MNRPCGSRPAPGRRRRAVATWIILLHVSVPLVATQDEEQIVVESIDIQGVTIVDESELEAILATRESSWLPWGETHVFDRETFEADLQRIESFYADRGYPGARVRTFDATLSEDQESIALTIVVDEGAPVIVESIDIGGLGALTPGERARIMDELTVSPNRPARRDEIESARTTVLQALQDRGYPLARVTVERRDREDGRIEVALVADPGPATVFGPVEVVGNDSVHETVVRRRLEFEPGDTFRVSALSRSQRRLYDLDLFQFVNVEARTMDMDQGTVPVRVTLRETAPRRVEISGGYGTEERLRGEASWRHLNAFGGARSAGVEGKWSALDRGVRADLTQPSVLDASSELTVSGERWFADEPAFQLSTWGARVSLSRPLTRPDLLTGEGAATTLAVGYVHEYEEFSIARDVLADASLRDELIALGFDPTTGDGEGLLTAVTLDLRRSTVASLLDGRRGYVVDGHLELGGSWLPGDYDYVEATLEGRHYLTLGPLGVFANRARAGVITAEGPLAEQVPFFKRYFLGGSNNLRGWGRFDVAPLSEGGLPIGGHAMLILSSELRVPVWGQLSLVGFVDAGNVWSEASVLDLSDLRYDAGPGIRYLTPIGPIRADIAFQLNPIPGLLVDGEPEPRTWRLHVSIGQAF